MARQFEVGTISVRYEHSIEGIKNFLTQFDATADRVIVQKTSDKSGLIKLSNAEEPLIYFKKGKVQKNELINKLSSMERQAAQEANPNLELLPIIAYKGLVPELVSEKDRKKIDRNYFGSTAEILYERNGDSIIPFIKELSLLDASQIMLQIEEYLKKDQEEEISSFYFMLNICKLPKSEKVYLRG
jgi:hypothetical protein